ncbi:uncharacterized protein [Penaeus vannamei]|uniref:uncharacterized protein n=1 Tax=Penaeus vannamei TaxID=6689 RepID=UPI00387F7C05
MEGCGRIYIFICSLLTCWIIPVASMHIASGRDVPTPTDEDTPTNISTGVESKADGPSRQTPPPEAEWLVCSPCWEGDACEHYADYYSPRFLVHATTVVLRANSTGIVYRSWSTDEDLGLTCPLGPGNSARCPCAAVAYQLFAPPGDHHFQLDAVTGFLTRNTSMSLEDGKTYTYKIMVQSIPVAGQSKDLLFDLMDLKIYVSPNFIMKIPWS